MIPLMSNRERNQMTTMNELLCSKDVYLKRRGKK